MRRAVSICSSAGPLLPIGKNTSGSESRQAERVAPRRDIPVVRADPGQCHASYLLPVVRRCGRSVRCTGSVLGALRSTRLLFAATAAKGLTRNFSRSASPDRRSTVGCAGDDPRARAPGRQPAGAGEHRSGVRAGGGAGADGVELDVHRTADGALVVRHDADAPAGRARPSSPLDAIRAAVPDVPTLAEVLDVCAGPLVNIEIKNLPRDPTGTRPTGGRSGRRAASPTAAAATECSCRRSTSPRVDRVPDARRTRSRPGCSRSWADPLEALVAAERTVTRRCTPTSASSPVDAAARCVQPGARAGHAGERVDRERRRRASQARATPASTRVITDVPDALYALGVLGTMTVRASGCVRDVEAGRPRPGSRRRPATGTAGRPSSAERARRRRRCTISARSARKRGRAERRRPRRAP